MIQIVCQFWKMAMLRGDMEAFNAGVGEIAGMACLIPWRLIEYQDVWIFPRRFDALI
jgi:hypothetical protein